MARRFARAKAGVARAVSRGSVRTRKWTVVCLDSGEKRLVETDDWKTAVADCGYGRELEEALCAGFHRSAVAVECFGDMTHASLLVVRDDGTTDGCEVYGPFEDASDALHPAVFLLFDYWRLARYDERY